MDVLQREYFWLSLPQCHTDFQGSKATRNQPCNATVTSRGYQQLGTRSWHLGQAPSRARVEPQWHRSRESRGWAPAQSPGSCWAHSTEGRGRRGLGAPALSWQPWTGQGLVTAAEGLICSTQIQHEQCKNGKRPLLGEHLFRRWKPRGVHHSGWISTPETAVQLPQWLI